MGNRSHCAHGPELRVISRRKQVPLLAFPPFCRFWQDRRHRRAEEPVVRIEWLLLHGILHARPLPLAVPEVKHRLIKAVQHPEAPEGAASEPALWERQPVAGHVLDAAARTYFSEQGARTVWMRHWPELRVGVRVVCFDVGFFGKKPSARSQIFTEVRPQFCARGRVDSTDFLLPPFATSVRQLDVDAVLLRPDH